MSKRQYDDAKSKKAVALPVSRHCVHDLSPETRGVIGGLFAKLRTKGVDYVNFDCALKELNIDIPKKTLYTWAKKVDKGVLTHATEKNSGNFALLTAPQEQQLVGWVLYRINKKKKVTRERARKYIERVYRVNMTTMTTANYLRENGFRLKKRKKRASSYEYDNEQLIDIAMKFFEQGAAKGCFKWGRDHTLFVDSMYASYGRFAEFSYGVVGGENPSSDDKIPQHTDCFVWAVSGGKKQPMRPVMFTFNPVFKKRNRTARRDKLTEEKERLLAKWGIAEDQVVYMGKEKNERRTYCAESDEIMETYMALQKKGNPSLDFRDFIIFRDAGVCYTKEGKDVFCELKFGDVVVLPPAIHQFVSPLDHSAWGVCKIKWRNSRDYHADSTQASLALLKEVMSIKAAQLQSWFKRNVWNPAEKLTREAMKDFIVNEGKPFSDYHDACLRAYKISIGENLKEHVSVGVVELFDRLDGNYWFNMKK